jgi:DNA-binding NtrC family response regulator
MLERAFILAGSNELKIEHFPMLTGESYAAASGKGTAPVSAGDAAAGPETEGRGILKDASKKARSKAEAEIIVNTLKETQWNRMKAAKKLKIDYKTLRTKIAEFNIHQDSKDG